MTAQFITTSDQDWRNRAHCRSMDPEIFFSPDNFTETYAVSVCIRLCTVRQQCLEWALNHKIPDGVWGGTTELDRRKITTPRSRTKCPQCSSLQVYADNHDQLCLACGLSWLS
jgi:hypothetical protein